MFTQKADLNEFSEYIVDFGVVIKLRPTNFSADIMVIYVVVSEIARQSSFLSNLSNVTYECGCSALLSTKRNIYSLINVVNKKKGHAYG